MASTLRGIAFGKWRQSDSAVVFEHDLKGCTPIDSEAFAALSHFAFEAGWDARSNIGLENIGLE